jgi:LysM repeat protein
LERRNSITARIVAVLALVGSLVAVVSVVNSQTGGSGGEGGQTRAGQQGGNGGGNGGENRPNPQRKNYEVQEGDNLTVISEKTGVPVDRIEALNPELDPQALIPGQKLKLR